MFTKNRWLLLFGILILSVGDFLLVINKQVNVGCSFILVQNILIPLLVTPLLMDNFRVSTQLARKLEWLLAGGIVGIFPTTGMILATSVNYFFYGGSEYLDTLKGITIPQSPQILTVSVLTIIFLWLSLVILSGFSGLISSILFSKF